MVNNSQSTSYNRRKLYSVLLAALAGRSSPMTLICTEFAWPGRTTLLCRRASTAGWDCWCQLHTRKTKQCQIGSGLNCNNMPSPRLDTYMLLDKKAAASSSSMMPPLGQSTDTPCGATVCSVVRTHEANSPWSYCSIRVRNF